MFRATLPRCDGHSYGRALEIDNTNKAVNYKSMLFDGRNGFTPPKIFHLCMCVFFLNLRIPIPPKNEFVWALHVVELHFGDVFFAYKTYETNGKKHFPTSPYFYLRFVFVFNISM